ncbi:hypothetical protein FZEAL_6885 [Fusarium zealandicum]|uniref:T6SS Phospholipase effector Tle1-like catalytic domain-containing protein n=1 Tax=Fusarium zealandicum TaxID=1053134 RepID=A0A8H4UGW9_9HYPO|nr:hypothetical protein FZEAL_6885 [Fusarium zealandicum]
MPYVESPDASEPKKLILCFDGTGNTFSGSNADTNVVKILSKLDRNDPNQYHYYQTGIGTYDIGETSVYKTVLGEMRSSITQTLDQGFGLTFDAHVMAGYRFLMRYYESGAKIYIFGFSRGAFTAKFLARMVNKVGLLCKGNEEMVPFAFRLYQRYLAGDVQDRVDAQQSQCDEQHQDTNINTNQDGSDADPLLAGKAKVHQSHTTEVALNEIVAFSQTFCRKETVKHCDKPDSEENIKVFFLGIWDCVNSVAVLERKTPVPVPVTGTAHYVRHAVAVDERRVKFKPALLAQDIRISKNGNHDHEDIKEVWFPGCHGDVGGGWPSVEDNALDNNKAGAMTFWQRVKNFWTSRKAKEASKNINEDRLQMSDIPLAWMIREVELVGEKEPEAAVKWCHSLKQFKKLINDKVKRDQAYTGFIHDSLSVGCGTAFFKVMMWKFMEFLPFITRWELDDNKKGWVKVHFPLNKGAARDIPRKAVLHASVIKRLQDDPSYCPLNNHGSDLPPCLKHNGKVSMFQKQEVKDKNGNLIQVLESDPEHQPFTVVQINQ